MTPANCIRSLEEFRYRIRRFLDFSRRAARAAGLAPQQHQMLLVLAGGPPGTDSRIRLLAERLFLNHNSAVELVNRLQRQGMVERVRRPQDHSKDRRQVGVRITPRGARVLARLTRHHLAELRSAGPELVGALQAAIAGARRAPRPRRARSGRRRGNR
ncbi:MAG TPA: MarR family winged helix-turn-helix transcriptional regulator [Candidatus Acidoferrales bacterium]|nr:MarR family winged helix-turn-helix transcriptional regulator [Candidatus Acidoferrales bacterium]